MARADGTQLLYCIPFAGLKSGVTTCIIPTELQSHWLGTYDDKAIQLVRAVGSVHFVGMEFIPFIECSNTIQESRRLGTYCAYMCQITKYRLYMARADGTQLLYCIPFAGLKSGVTI